MDETITHMHQRMQSWEEKGTMEISVVKTIFSQKTTKLSNSNF
jgi:hypothetical protein